MALRRAIDFPRPFLDLELYTIRDLPLKHCPYGYFQSVPAYRVNGHVSRFDQFEYIEKPCGNSTILVASIHQDEKRSRVERMEEPKRFIDPTIRPVARCIADGHYIGDNSTYLLIR